MLVSAYDPDWPCMKTDCSYNELCLDCGVFIRSYNNNDSLSLEAKTSGLNEVMSAFWLRIQPVNATPKL